MNFRRRPILCTTLYRNPMQATNFGGTFDQLFLRIFLYNFHRRCLSTSSLPWCKKVKNDQKLKSRGGGGSCLKYSVDSIRVQLCVVDNIAATLQDVVSISGLYSLTGRCPMDCRRCRERQLTVKSCGILSWHFFL